MIKLHHHLSLAHWAVSYGFYDQALEELFRALKLANVLGRKDIKRHIFVALNVLRPLIQK